jgi:hypothetical protein
LRYTWTADRVLNLKYFYYILFLHDSSSGMYQVYMVISWNLEIWKFLLETVRFCDNSEIAHYNQTTRAQTCSWDTFSKYTLYSVSFFSCWLIFMDQELSGTNSKFYCVLHSNHLRTFHYPLSTIENKVPCKFHKH